MLTWVNDMLRRIPAWVLYPGLALPGVVYFYWGVTNQLGADPVERLEHQYGEWALQLMIAVLAITPLRRFVGLNLLKFRRAVGLMSFFYVVLHLMVWVVLDKWLNWAGIWEDIVKRPFITVGMLAFLLLLPLAVTSNNQALRKLGGAAWRKLHLLTYPAAITGAVHYLLIVKSWPPEPMIYLAIVTGLVAMRVLWTRMPRRANRPGAAAQNQS